MGKSILPVSDWRELALCRNLTPQQADEIFFGPSGGRRSNQKKEFCKNCPVLDKCLEEALSNPHTVGIWAGTTESERERMVDFLDIVPLELEGVPSPMRKKSRRLRRHHSPTTPPPDSLDLIPDPSDEEIKALESFG